MSFASELKKVNNSIESNEDIIAKVVPQMANDIYDYFKSRCKSEAQKGNTRYKLKVRCTWGSYNRLGFERTSLDWSVFGSIVGHNRVEWGEGGSPVNCVYHLYPKEKYRTTQISNFIKDHASAIELHVQQLMCTDGFSYYSVSINRTYINIEAAW